MTSKPTNQKHKPGLKAVCPNPKIAGLFLLSPCPEPAGTQAFILRTQKSEGAIGKTLDAVQLGLLRSVVCLCPVQASNAGQRLLLATGHNYPYKLQALILADRFF